MSDWQVGDLALCIRGGRGKHSSFKLDGVLYRENSDEALVEGKIYTIRIMRAADDHIGCGLVEVAGPWRLDRFRKIRPDEHEQCEPEFVELLKRSRQRVQA